MPLLCRRGLVLLSQLVAVGTLSLQEHGAERAAELYVAWDGQVKVPEKQCAAYLRQSSAPGAVPIKVLTLNETEAAEACCSHCTSLRMEPEKACMGFQLIRATTSRYCLLATGAMYNRTVTAPQGAWFARLPMGLWPEDFHAAPADTSTTTTTTSATTSTPTTSTISTTSTTFTSTSTSTTTTTTGTTTTTTSTDTTTTTTPSTTSSAVITSAPQSEPVTSAKPAVAEDSAGPPERAQATPTQWRVAGRVESCDATCLDIGEVCDARALQRTADSQRQTQLAFALAGFRCSSYGTGCAPQDCPDWGAPFLHQSFFEGSSELRDGQGDPCFFGNAVAACDVVPGDKNHRRLCACSASRASALVVGYEILRVSDTLAFLASGPIKEALAKSAALLSEVPVAAVKIELQFLQTPEQNEAAAGPGSVVMIHVINASLAGKPPDAVRAALSQEVDISSLDEKLSPLLDSLKSEPSEAATTTEGGTSTTSEEEEDGLDLPSLADAAADVQKLLPSLGGLLR